MFLFYLCEGVETGADNNKNQKKHWKGMQNMSLYSFQAAYQYGI